MNDSEIFKKYLLDGDLDGVRNSLQLPFLEIIVEDGGNMRPIHWACHVGNLEIVEILIKAEADMESVDGLGRRPIHRACRKGHFEIVKLLLEHAVNVEAEDELCNMRPIHWACLDGYLEIAKFLIQHAVDLECEDGDRRRPIHLACQQGHFEVTKLLIQHEVDMESEDREGRRPIHCTVNAGHLEITKLLIQNAVDIECEDGLGRAPIHWACRQGHLEILALLIEKEVYLECEDEQKRRPIHWACQQGHLKIVAILIEKDVDLECEDEQERRPIHLACQQGCLEIVALLIEKDVDLECEDEEKLRPIHWACEEGHFKIAKLLIENKIDLECEDRNGCRPIHLACENEHLEIVKLLTDFKCIIDCKTMDGSTPLDLAMNNEHEECIKLIQEIIDKNKKVFDYVRHDDDVTLDKLYKSQIFFIREYETQLSVLEVAIQTKAKKVIKYLFNRKVKDEEITSIPIGLSLLMREFILYRSIRDNHYLGCELLCSADIINGKHRIIQSSVLELAAKTDRVMFVNEILKKSLYNKDSWQRAKTIAKSKGHYKIVELISEREHLLKLRMKSQLSILHTAVFDNDENMVQYILDNQLVNPDMNNKKFGTALALAYSLCYRKCIRILEQYKVKSNTCNRYWETPLHEAITSGMVDNCQYLLDNSLDIDVTGFMGFTALHSAVINGHSDLCTQLIDRGADCSRSVDLSHAISEMETETREFLSTRESVASLCLKYQETIYHGIMSQIDEITANFSDGDNNSLLHLSARCVQPHICQQLINAGAVVDPINNDGNTPLLEILSNVDNDNTDYVIDVVQLLIESGSDISITSMTGKTVYQCASIFRNERLMLALVAHQAEVSNITEEDFKLAFSEKWHKYAEVLISRLDKRSLLSYITSDTIHLAMAEATSNLVKLLFKNATIQVQQSTLEEILYMSVSNNDDDLFDYLISEDIRVPRLFENGENLLSILLTSNKVKHCRKLLQSINGKHFVNLRNGKGQTPLQVAVEMKIYHIVEKLIFKSNVINNEDNDGNTALAQLFTQISNNNDEIMESRLVVLVKSIICRGGDIYKVTTKNSQVINCCTNQSVRSDVEEFFAEQQQQVAGPITERVIEVEKMICTICTTREVDCVLQCGHTFCMQCGQEFVRCPTCNADSTTFKRIFFG